eukprot:900564-Prymnesium_polylepis.1
MNGMLRCVARGAPRSNAERQPGAPRSNAERGARCAVASQEHRIVADVGLPRSNAHIGWAPQQTHREAGGGIGGISSGGGIGGISGGIGGIGGGGGGCGGDGSGGGGSG